MGRHAWTDFELDVLYLHINDVEWFDAASHLLGSRTNGAIRTKMAALREEAGIAPSRSLNATDRATMKSVTGSDRLAIACNALREREVA